MFCCGLAGFGCGLVAFGCELIIDWLCFVVD